MTRVRDAFTLVNPLNGQRFASELAAVSHNLLIVFATGGARPVDPYAPSLSEFDIYDPEGLGIINNPDSPYNGQVRPGVDPAAVNGVTSVHDLHIWSLSSRRAALSAHVVVRDLESWPQILAEMTELLHSAFEIDHSTLQPELFRPALYAIGEPERPRANP